MVRELFLFNYFEALSNRMQFHLSPMFYVFSGSISHF